LLEGLFYPPLRHSPIRTQRIRAVVRQAQQAIGAGDGFDLDVKR